jgi:hypothetical protein
MESCGVDMGFYEIGMGCRHSWPLLCFHASNIRTTGVPVVDKSVKAILFHHYYTASFLRAKASQQAY